MFLLVLAKQVCGIFAILQLHQRDSSLPDGLVLIDQRNEPLDALDIILLHVVLHHVVWFVVVLLRDAIFMG